MFYNAEEGLLMDMNDMGINNGNDDVSTRFEAKVNRFKRGAFKFKGMSQKRTNLHLDQQRWEDNLLRKSGVKLHQSESNTTAFHLEETQERVTLMVCFQIYYHILHFKHQLLNTKYETKLNTKY